MTDAATLDEPRALPAARPAPAADDLRARIVEALELDIVLGRLHPRERLIEQNLAERFQTNRSTVRAALADLERRALIVRRPNAGATVVDLGPEEVRRIYEAREALETAALGLIRFPVAAPALERLHAIQAAHAAAVAAGDLGAVFRTNLRFHEALHELSGNPHLVELIELMAARSRAVRAYAHPDGAVLARTVVEHQEMIEALAAGAGERLVALQRAHLKPSIEAYLEAYRRRFPWD